MLILKKQIKRYKRALKHFGIKHIILNYLKKFITPIYIKRDVLIGHIYKNADFKKYPIPSDINFRKLDISEIDRLVNFSPFITKKEALSRFDSQHICYIAEIDKNIIFNTWAGDGNIFIPLINKSVSFPKGELIYFYNTYTHPDFISKRLLPMFLTYMHSIYDQEKSTYKEARVYLDMQLKLPLKAYKKITGVTEFTQLIYTKWLFKHKYMYKNEK